MEQPRHPLPGDVEQALNERGLMAAFEERPAYQHNDYLGWIAEADGEEARRECIAQMLDELAHGGVYMGLPYNPSEGA